MKMNSMTDDSILTAIDGRRRVAVEHVQPAVDCGRFPIKRTVGDRVHVTADVFADGHDVVRAALLSRQRGTDDWHTAPMTPLGNDLWQGEFTVEELGQYEYTVRGWVDAFETWHRDLKKRITPGRTSRSICKSAPNSSARLLNVPPGRTRERLRHWQTVLAGGTSVETYQAAAAEMEELSTRHPDLRFAVQCERPLPVEVDRTRARFSTWYELFPRSTSTDPDAPRHAARLHWLAAAAGRDGL